MSYNRYSEVSESGRVELLPYVKIDVRPTDKYEQYILGTTRFDLLSEKYYDNPNYDWLILLANPDLGLLEFDIEDGEYIRIPFPFEVALETYKNKIERYKSLYTLT